MVNFKDRDTGIDSSRPQRKVFLKNILGDDYQSYDTRASIYQLQYAFNTGIWLNNSLDLYEMLYGKQFNDKKLRNAFKSLCMPMFFEVSFNSMSSHIFSRMFQERSPNNQQSIRQVLSVLYSRFKNVLGTTFKSEIFLHESAIYMHVFYMLVNSGWKIVQVYDRILSEFMLTSQEV